MTKPIDTDALRALAGRAPAEIEHVQYGEPYVEPICNEFYEAAREAVPALLDRLRELEGALREACDLGSATEAPRGTGAETAPFVRRSGSSPADELQRTRQGKEPTADAPMKEGT